MKRLFVCDVFDLIDCYSCGCLFDFVWFVLVLLDVCFAGLLWVWLCDDWLLVTVNVGGCLVWCLILLFCFWFWLLDGLFVDLIVCLGLFVYGFVVCLLVGVVFFVSCAGVMFASFVWWFVWLLLVVLTTYLFVFWGWFAGPRICVCGLAVGGLVGF